MDLRKKLNFRSHTSRTVTEPTFPQVKTGGPVVKKIVKRKKKRQNCKSPSAINVLQVPSHPTRAATSHLRFLSPRTVLGGEPSSVIQICPVLLSGCECSVDKIDRCERETDGWIVVHQLKLVLFY